MTSTFRLEPRLQARIALLAIGRSTLRNQGAKGMVRTARCFLTTVDLQQFSVETHSDFIEVLERQTRRLMRKFPEKARKNWGAARKAVNIFIRDVVYCCPLQRAFKLAKIEPWLELPLDSYAYAGLVGDMASLADVPAWPGVKHLTPDVSQVLQLIASKVAVELRTLRVHLDIRYWRKPLFDEIASK